MALLLTLSTGWVVSMLPGSLKARAPMVSCLSASESCPVPVSSSVSAVSVAVPPVPPVPSLPLVMVSFCAESVPVSITEAVPPLL